MTKRLLAFSAGLALRVLGAHAQATLGISPYVETFDNLASGLPAGFSVYTAATATSLGTAPTAAQLFLTPSATTAWNSVTGGFKNYASATGLNQNADVATQTAAPNRALGVRQTGSFGDGTNVGPAFVFQLANTTGKTDFALSFKLQSLDSTIMTATATGRTTVWRVDYGLGATPTAFTQVGSTATTGPVFSNATLTASFGGALDNLAGPVWIRIVAPAGTTGSGSRPSSAIDDFSLSWNANANAPTLTVAPSALDFGKQTINQPSAAKTYTLTGTNLTNPVVARNTRGEFTVSKDGTAFSDSVLYTVAELAQPRQVFVRFTANRLGQASGVITGGIINYSAGATARTVTVTGTGNDPTQTVYDFNACTGGATLSDGWIQYSVTGPQTWACTTFGRDPGNPSGTTAYPNAVQMNGYASGNIANEDWLISPALTLTSTTYPLLSYWTRTAFNGPALRLRVSTNYSGTGDPNASGVTWTDLNAEFPAQGSDVWQTSFVDLSGYKAGTVYVAFVYNSTTNAAARWTVDDVVLTNSATPAPPTLRLSLTDLNFGYQPVNTAAYKIISLTTGNLTGPLTITSPNAAFQLGKDSLTYSPSLMLSQIEASNQQLLLRVRFLPTQAETNYATTTTATTAGVGPQALRLSGNTYDVAKTLEVANWNMEWFGSTASGQGPTDVALQQANATTVLQGLAADVYVLEEVVDTVRLRNVAADLSTRLGVTYGYKIADFGSYGDNIGDADYPGDQKVTFIYRQDVVKPVLFQGLLRCTQADACPAWGAWASGRFPYLMAADVTLDGVTKRINFVGIHAKANATTTSPDDYARRQTGADLLKNLLDTSYAGTNTLVLGDYNDVLNGTIATGVTPAVSSYNSFVADSADYVALTLPLAKSGAQSTVSFNTVIDNVIATKPMAAYYISGSAAVRTDLAASIADYGTTTSDHYPVFTRYSFSVTPLAARSAATAALGLYPNPVTNTVRFDIPETDTGLSLSVYTTTGQVVLNSTGSAEQLNQQLAQRVGGLNAGLYVVRVVGKQQTYVSRFQKL
ncbi:T9SS-dependent choice-of-anchor J family protein [Hymenobacter psoromatis]|uniref:T9SS-dependent choice-of-anchor J family protein n=1 Tax=Hymenobacter psoromatis TaxID=1484116 RepID=UPI001CBC1A85|nr:choice-of-anchor J domain-containing protein [Hymenobacter psoromatis]